MDAPQLGQESPRRGVSVYAVLIVLLIVAIAVVAIQIARQHRGTKWNLVNTTSEGAMPRCLWPRDAAYVQGRVDIYPGLPGYVAHCFTQKYPTPTPASNVVSDLLPVNNPAFGSACDPDGGASLWYQGTGTYSCRHGQKPEGFYWANWSENTERENLPAAAWKETYDQRRRRLHREGYSGTAAAARAEADALSVLSEGFSPDAPGACD